MGKPPTLPYINLTDVTVRVPDLKLEVPPGGTCEVPEAYTKWRGTRPSVIAELAPQLQQQRVCCQTCGTMIGQADASGVLVEWVHTAPCGLPCAGRGSDAHGNNEQVHHNRQTCARCSPKKCPVCNGVKDSVQMGIYGQFLPEWRPSCSRCNGRGWVDGLELWLADHAEGV